jgi:hypothetical protein
MLISTYFKPNIHQNGPEILGVKVTKNMFHGMYSLTYTIKGHHLYNITHKV